VAQYVSEKVSDLSAFIFFWILHEYVSNEYRYRICIQVSDMLWVEVSVFSRMVLYLLDKIRVILGLDLCPCGAATAAGEAVPLGFRAT
jgi:hypothetical protein